ncbi:endopeptidase La [candidate division CSSED10-310 bacterium]|uniref:Lon protease n=1 Tax=candidate division CSSED10-310 bacterium TaxID=2855610 RepID=A0ABV6YZF1_UNCC1
MIFKSKDKSKDQKEESREYPLISLKENIVLPYQVVPLVIGRLKSVKALQSALQSERRLFLVTQRDAEVKDPDLEELYTIGTIADILQHLELPDGTIKILVEGKERAKILEFDAEGDHIRAILEVYDEENEHDLEADILMKRVLNKFEEFYKIVGTIPKKTYQEIRRIKEPARLADTIISQIDGIKIEEKQKFLDTISPLSRLEILIVLLSNRIEIVTLERKIQDRVKKQIEESQREYYLNEQLKAIYQELGSKKHPVSYELQELQDKITQAKMPEDIHKRALREFDKLKNMPPMSAEGTVIRNYLDWLTSLPWSIQTEDIKDLDQAVKILDADHYGLRKVKERIIEYLAVHQLVETLKGPILCFVGPPGVGKTSLARSIARSMSKKFVRLSLGGIRDEAEIRGHRRTYIGALPGRIIQSLKKVACKNPVFLLDEVDKMSVDFRGDPAAALLEVLDPEQNHAFSDHYLEVDFDLSKVFFITTANSIHRIPYALRDRMEVIELPGYIENEKIQIAKHFLLPKQIELNGLKPGNLHLPDSTLSSIIRFYTREAGVRNLEREIASICRKVAKKVVMKGQSTRVKIYERNLNTYLDIPKFRCGEKETEDTIGMATGLAWTEVGGELMIIETTILEGKGNLILTGNMGEVMQESAKAALSYVRSRRTQLNLTSDFYKTADIHIHIPQGSVPKDGPSAGIAIATSLISALIKKPVSKDLALTGEITLRGRILPIGGLKEKVLAAHRVGIEKIIIPDDNEREQKEIPAEIRKSVEFVFARHMDTVLQIAFNK